MPEQVDAPETSPLARLSSDIPRLSVGRLLRSRTFWETRSLHPIARPLLLVVVGVLMLIAIAFIVASGRFTRFDLVAIAMYIGFAAFAWHPVTAAFTVMLVGSVGVVFTASGGDLIELALAGCLVAATCSRGIVLTYCALLVALTVYLDITTSTLTDGGLFGIAGIALVALLAGISFRLITAREALLVEDRTQLVARLERIARDDQERIADELHDGIAHDLTLVLFHARALPKQPDAAGRELSLATIEESADRALHSIQSLLALMRGPAVGQAPTREERYNAGLMDTVANLGTLLNDAGIRTRVGQPSRSLHLPAASERLLAAAAIEAVTNILKHAPKSSTASIGLNVRTSDVELIVENVTTKAPVVPDSHLGGRGLGRARQRLEQFLGTLDATATNSGWTVRATVPRVSSDGGSERETRR